MFCGNCGAKLEDDSTFCTECGAKIENPALLSQNQLPVRGGTTGAEPKPKLSERWRAMDKKQKGICAVIAAAVICGAAVWQYSNSIVRLDPYISVEFTGYEGIGRVHATFDREAFARDYGSKLKLNTKSKSDDLLKESSGQGNDVLKALAEWGGQEAQEERPEEALAEWIGQGNAATEAWAEWGGQEAQEERPEEAWDEWSGQDNGVLEAFGKLSSQERGAMMILDRCVAYELDKTDGLKNGDEVTLTWNCDELAFSTLCGKKIKCSEQVFTVEGLEEIKLIDPFEKIKVEYSGISSQGYAAVDTSAVTEEYLYNLTFFVEPEYDLSNGDTIKMSIYGYDEDYFAEEFGIGLSCTEKTYTVSGLGEYISSAEDISEDVLQRMISQGIDEINAYTAREWYDEVSLDSVKYVGNYFLKAKGNNSYSQNEMILVYKVNYTVTLEETGGQEAYSYYTCISYPDIIKNDDEVVVDLQQYEGYYGAEYKDLDALYKEMVATRVNAFTVEDNIDD